MSILSNEYQDRLKHWNRVLQQDFYHQLGKVDFEGFSVMEQLTPEQASQGEFVPIPKNFKWGKPWEHLWLKGTIVLPIESEGMPIVMDLRLSGESTLFVNMRAFGTLRAEWVTTPHHFMADNFLTEAAVPGTKYDLLFEVYSEIGFLVPKSDRLSPKVSKLLLPRKRAMFLDKRVSVSGMRMHISYGWMFQPCRNC